MQNNILFLKTQPSLEEAKIASPVLSEFLESTHIIVSNIFNLFSAENPSRIADKIIRSENIVGKIKKQIIRKSVQLDATGVLSIIKNLT